MSPAESPIDKLVHSTVDLLAQHDAERQAERLQAAIDAGELPAGTRLEDLTDDERTTYVE